MLRGAGAIAKFIAVVALVVGGGAAALFAGVLPTAQAQAITDYDVDDNGLIEVGDLAQLNAMRWDLDGDGDPAGANAGDYLLAFPDRDTATSTLMGCPSGNCAGYELAGNLTFGATSTWTPIADFAATLDGAGHTITGLNINVSSGNAGLFASLTGSARVRDLGLVGASVTSTAAGGIGILAGSVAAGAVLTGVYAAEGRILGSSVASGVNVGGLVGELRGTLRAGYATASVNLTNIGNLTRSTGGLVGWCVNCTIIASYAAGPVASTVTALYTGGLLGNLTSGAITNSFCDAQAAGQANCINVTAPPRPGYNTAAMQAPTGYTGIYLNWNLDTDGDGLPNYPWNFGTSADYPTLHTPAQRAAATPAPMDYDADDNDRIDIHTPAQLYAIGWDTDGDGSPETANANAYSTAFGGHTAGMGCDTTCNGYELAADLIFPAAAGPYNPWPPIPAYNGLLDGNGRSIINLRVEHDGDNAGLFETLGGSSTVRELLLVNPNVTATGDGNVGSLAGRVLTGGAVSRVGVLGGRIAATQTSSSRFVRAGGLIGRVDNGAAVSDSYSSTELTMSLPGNTFAGGLVGHLSGSLTNSFAYGRIAAVNDLFIGGLIGITSISTTSTAVYCDTEASGQPDCIGTRAGSYWPTSTSPILEYTTAELQTPTDYTGIYEPWAPADPGVPLWDFGGPTDYPTLWFARGAADSPPPGGPRYAQPPQDTPYDPAADHPEVYVNDRYEMLASCEVQTGADGAAEGSRISFDLGRYQGAVILHLAIWSGEFFMSYESQGIAMPPFEREGQSASVRVVTDPGETRFLLDGVSPTRNLVLGYADCHTDDPGAASADPAESAATSTAVTSTPAAPRVYGNERYGMTASCEVRDGADGEAEGAVIRFDLGCYEGAVILHLSRWNGEYYASYESLGIDVPPFQRDGQSATVRVATDPAQTRFLLDSASPTMNLVLGYADCHTAGE